MNIIGKYYRLVCITMIIVVIGGVNGLAQEGKEVVYRDYTHMEADLLDSLKRCFEGCICYGSRLSR